MPFIKTDRPSLTQQEIRADQELAKEFFKNNPGERFCGMKNGRKFSYFKSTNGEIFRRTELLGKGAFGRTKLAVNIDTGQKVALKRQIPGPFYLTSLQEEAAINLDLGVAVTPLEIRKKNGSVYKVYQGMKNLGRPMDQYLENEGLSAPLEKRLEYSIQLLLRVHDLHTGAASKLRKPYAHCDIKPANICLDESGRIHLIDFGLTRDSNLDAKHTVVSGTPGYLPQNIKGPEWFLNPHYVETPSYFFDDKIAVLRSIFHPASTMLKGFLTEHQFNSLPSFIKDVLISDDIKTCITKNYPLLSIAAVLALYQVNRSCTKEEVAKILGSIEESKKHIARFQLYNDWVFYLKHDSALFSVDFSVLDQEKKNLLSQAFDETLETINKKNVKLLREKGIINDSQISSKPQYRYDLEISPLKDNIQYWKAILSNPQTLPPPDVLFNILQHETDFNVELIPSSIRDRTIRDLINNVFVANGNILTQQGLLNYIKDKKIKLTDDEYEKILKLNSLSDTLKAYALKDACDSHRKFISLNLKKLLSPKEYLEILQNKDIGWIKAFMTKELWVAYLKEDTLPFNIDFTQLDATQKDLISRAVNGVNVHVQDQRIYIAKLKEYGTEILRVTTKGFILFKTLEAKPQVSDEYLQAIIQNPIFDLNLIKLMCNINKLSSNIISELISKFFSASGDDNSQSYLLNYLKTNRLTLTDEQFGIISSNFKITNVQDMDTLLYFAEQCNTVDRLKLFYKNESKYLDKLNILEEEIFLRYFQSDETKLELIKNADIGEKVAIFLLKKPSPSQIDIINEFMDSHKKIKDDALFRLLLKNITKEKLSANLGVFLANCTSVERLPDLISKLGHFTLNNDFLKFVMNEPDKPHFDVLSHTLGALSYQELKNSAASLLPQDNQWKKLFEKADNLYKANHVDAAKDILCILFKMHYQQTYSNLNDETFKKIMKPHTAIQKQRGFKYFLDKLLEIFFWKKPESLQKQSFFKTKSEEMVESLKENIVPTPKKN